MRFMQILIKLIYCSILLFLFIFIALAHKIKIFKQESGLFNPGQDIICESVQNSFEMIYGELFPLYRYKKRPNIEDDNYGPEKQDDLSINLAHFKDLKIVIEQIKRDCILKENGMNKSVDHIYNVTNLEEWASSLPKYASNNIWCKLKNIALNPRRVTYPEYNIETYTSYVFDLNESLDLLNLSLEKIPILFRKYYVNPVLFKSLTSIADNLEEYAIQIKIILKLVYHYDKHGINSRYIYSDHDFTNTVSKNVSLPSCPYDTYDQASHENELHDCKIYYKNSLITIAINIINPLNTTIADLNSLRYDHQIKNYFNTIIKICEQKHINDIEFPNSLINKRQMLKYIIEKYFRMLLMFDAEGGYDILLAARAHEALTKRIGGNVVFTLNWYVSREKWEADVEISYLTVKYPTKNKK